MFAQSVLVLWCLSVVARAVSHDVPCNTSYITQWIDHSNHSIGTFQQQTQVITKYFKPGGPILFYHGEESADMTCVETTSMLEYARQLGGIAATIEHRYFGLSLPFGPNQSYTTEGFKYLTLDNTMDDAVEFVQQIKSNFSSADNSHVIVASGSYGGFLATALRLNRPHAIFGAISSSPAVSVFLAANGITHGRFNWWNWVSNVVADKSASAAASVKRAFAAVENVITSGNMPSLQGKLGLCRAPNSTADEALLISLLKIPFEVSSEYQYLDVIQGRNPIANPLNALIQTIQNNTDDPFQLLKSTTLLWFKAVNSSLSCLDFETAGQQAVSGVQSVPFAYIVCSYFPLVTSGVSNDTIFPAQDPASSATVSNCISNYGAAPLTAEQLAQRYHLSQADYENSERILFSVGQYDPTTSIAPRSFPSTANRNASKILYVSNMAHREDLFAPGPKDKLEVIQARAIEIETIKGWLGLYT